METEDRCKTIVEMGRALMRELPSEDAAGIRQAMEAADEAGAYKGDELVHTLRTAVELCRQVAPSPPMVGAILLQPAAQAGTLTLEQIRERWGDDTASLVEGRMRVATIYGHRQSAVQAPENFRNLLLTFAKDIRVIIIMIVDRLVLMREINHHPDQQWVRSTAEETSYLYSPLAHRLGLYKIKSEMEDLSMKYTQRQVYSQIAAELNAKKAARDAYIKAFIGPVKERLEAAGLKFEIKGRTKSIASIWNKLKKQQIDVKDVYDLFAVRVILDTPLEREKPECWHVYSIIADMYTPNPARLKDWLSIPKSNGYESLHTTVQGPEGKWVEVQIRSHRMDLVAEKGLAAHWRYKGIKSGGEGLDKWMNNIRDILESGVAGPTELMKETRIDLYDNEVFVFTPKGALHKLPHDATVLDLAFAIHSGLGCQCTGARVNGKARKLNHKLQSGDTVEILTSQQQSPKRDWLNYVVTSKARNKIRQSLKEREKRAAEYGRELLERRARNRKIELDDRIIMQLIKQRGYKQATDFYCDLGMETADAGAVLAEYEALVRSQSEEKARVSAADFQLAEGAQPPVDDTAAEKGAHGDAVVIGEGVRGMKYRLARCCNPICGDPVFGFVSAEGVIKIHREDCPNAADIRSKYPYRVIPVRWGGATGQQMGATIWVEGRDDIGIVTNLTSIINKENNVSLRNIQIDTDDGGGTFRGRLTVGISDQGALNSLIRKLRTVKGLRKVERG